MEEFKIVKGFENYYISNLGRVKSVFKGKEKFLKGSIDFYGYLKVNLYNNKVGKTRKIHKLVAIEFLNHTPCGLDLVINHINFNKLDNRVENLEIVTNRENSNQKHRKSSSKYTGVTWKKDRNKWMAQIRFKNKRKFLGYFLNEIEASNAYEKELLIFNELKNVKNS